MLYTITVDWVNTGVGFRAGRASGPNTAVTRQRAFAALLCLFVSTLFALPTGGTDDDKKLPRHAERWVKRTLERMSLEEKVGQLMMITYFGDFTSVDSPEYQRLTRQLKELHPGGLIVVTRPRQPTGFDRSEIYALAHLSNRLQRLSPTPLLVSADFERGAGFRIRATTSFPHNMSLGASGDPELAYWMGRIAAAEARALGVHWLLAPVADVNNNPLNPIINIRSFGEDPAAVSRMVAAFVRGCEEARALCTAKHFPGTGDIALDPHLTLATVTADRARLDRVELAPFRAAIDAGVSSIMTEHIAVPALEPDPTVPATFSYAITTELLRRQMGYNGLVITDALDMSAITNLVWPGEAAVRAVEAGADVILMSPEPEAAYAALRRAVLSGRITESRLDDSVERILRAKARLGLHREAQVEPDAIDSIIANRTFEEQADVMASSGVALLRDDSNLLPLDATRLQRGFLLAVSADPDSYPAGELERELRPRVDSLLVTRADRYFSKPEQVTLPSPALYDWSIIAVFVRIADRKGNVALPENLAALVNRVLADGKPAALVILGSPYLAERFPLAKTVLCAFSTAEVAERAAARALFGQTAIGARLPVTVPQVAKLGAGLDRPAVRMELAAPLPQDAARFEPIAALLRQAVGEGVAPGGVVAVGYRGRLAMLEAEGRLRYDDDAGVQPDTLYDLASLTKVVATTTAAMMLYERGQLSLDTPVVNYIPELKRGPDAAAKQGILVRHLLTHSSGLPGYVRFYQEVKTRAQLFDRIYELPLEYPTGSQSVYSDLGIILLGEVIERASGRSLDHFLQENLFGPLGMRGTMFNPPRNLRDRIAPTEDDREFRHRLVRGEVHDENAFVMGGVAPHAGLFSTAGDLAVFCQMLLNGGVYAHRRFLRRSTIELFTSRQPVPGSTRGLGWDTPSEPSSGGQYLSRRAFGHTGFTGTSIWIDPEKKLFVILLTNRVHPTRTNERIRAFRPRLHDAVVQALGLAPNSPRPAGNE
ncbi:MAG: glycoside hydrolase family 3 N-terminal domain-containing protein [Candidatus Acidiferrales bacterium]